jgi:hypothetical protein
MSPARTSTRPTAYAVGYSLSPFGLGVRRQEPKMYKLQGLGAAKPVPLPLL